MSTSKEVVGTTTRVHHSSVSKKSQQQSLECTVCKLASSILEAILEQDRSEDEVGDLVKAVCIILEIEDKNVCDGIVEEFKKEVLTVAYSISLGRAKQLCAILLGPSCEPRYNPKNQTAWNISIPGNKPQWKPIPDPKVRFSEYSTY